MPEPEQERRERQVEKVIIKDETGEKLTITVRYTGPRQGGGLPFTAYEAQEAFSRAFNDLQSLG
jgi:hypothetical protein